MANVLTLEETAAYLRVHSSTIYRMLKRQQLPAFKVGSDWRFNVESLDRWLIAAENGFNAVPSSAEAKNPLRNSHQPRSR
jgi:excisionase family DNA binding protein